MPTLPTPEGYYVHDEVLSDIPAKTPTEELALFEGIMGPSPVSGTTQEKLVERVTTFAESHGFYVYVATPDALNQFQWLVNTRTYDRVLVLFLPGYYYEADFKYYDSSAYEFIWFYGITDGVTRPRILGLRNLASTSGPAHFWGSLSNQRFIYENIELAGFGHSFKQSGNGDFLARGCFMHSHGGRALYRAVGCDHHPMFASTYLIDNDLRHAPTSHCVYLDWGKRTVISGNKISRQQIVSHCIKNETSEASLVEGNQLMSGIDGYRGYEYTNPWALASQNPDDPPRTQIEYGGSTPYDGISGTTWILLRDNTFRMIGSGSAIASAQNREAASGNHPAYPLPYTPNPWDSLIIGHYNSCSLTGYLPSSTPPGEMWTDEYWSNYVTQKHILLRNTFEVVSNTQLIPGMLGFTFSSSMPNKYDTLPANKYFNVDAGWHEWLEGKLANGFVLNEIYEADNTFPATLPVASQWNFHGNNLYLYGTLPTENDVVHTWSGPDPDPLSVDPMLRRWTGAEWVEYVDSQVLPPPNTVISIQGSAHSHSAEQMVIGYDPPEDSTVAPQSATHAHSGSQPTLASAGEGASIYWVIYPSVQADPTGSEIVEQLVTGGVYSTDLAPTSTEVGFTGAGIDGLTTTPEYKLAAVWHSESKYSNVEVSGAFSIEEAALIIATGQHAHQSEDIALNQLHNLLVDAALHGQESTVAAITQLHTVIVDSTAHAVASGEVTLAQVHALVVAVATHGVTSNETSLTQLHQLLVDSAAHAEDSSEPGITQIHLLNASNAAHGHLADAVTLTQLHTLIVNATNHALGSTEPAFDGTQSLAIQSAYHAQTAANAVINTLVSVLINSSAHSTVSAEAALGQIHDLVIASSQHSHATDNVDFAEIVALVIQAAVHSHSADQATLDHLVELLIQSATHGHASESVTLSQAHILAILGSSHVLTSSNVSFDQIAELFIQSSQHGHVVTGAVLSMEHLVSISDAQHALLAYEVALSVGEMLDIQNVLHGLVSDSVAFGQNHILIVNDALHHHLAQNVNTVVAFTDPRCDGVIFVKAENRYIIVSAESRVTDVTSESRVTDVTSESRRTEITKGCR